MWRPVRPLPIGVALLSAVACAGDRGSSLQVYLYTAPAVVPSEVFVRVTHRAGERTLTGRDFLSDGVSAPHTSSLTVATGGDLAVAVVLVKAGADTVGVGALRIPLEANMRYGVTLHVTSVNPLNGCIGCRGVAAFPLLGSLAGGADTLFIAWGGTPRGAIT